MTDQPPDWAVSVPSTDLIHQRPPQEVTRPFEQQSLLEIGLQLIEQFLSQVVEAIVGVFIPGGLGSAFEQLRDWAEDLGDIPIVGDILDFILDVFGIDIQGDGGPFDSGDIFSNIPIIGDILAMLGFGGGGSTGGSSGEPGSGGFDPIGAIFDFLFGWLAPAGAVTGNTPVPPHQLGSLAPGTSPNDLPDTFTNPKTVAGQGRWTVEPVGVLRTVRPNMLTVFYVIGTVDPKKYTLAEATGLLRTGAKGDLDEPLNLDQLEIVFVTFFEGDMLNMGPGRREGVANLRAQIKTLPVGQKFAFVGLSEGAAVCSDIYDELRSGNMQDRRDDLVAAVMFGNPRRETGVTFTDPEWGVCPDPAPGTSGVSPSRLSGTEPFWWEMAIHDDPVTVVSDTDEVGEWMREYYKIVHEGGFGVFTAALSMVFPFLSPSPAATEAMQTLLNLAGSGHERYHVDQPFGHLGDTRNYFQVAVDYLNGVAATQPEHVPELHQMLGVPYPAVPGEAITAAVDVAWHNFPTFEGPAILLVLNAYNAAGDHLATVVSDDCDITDPDPSSDFEFTELAGVFMTPAETATVRPMLQCAEQVMGSGIAWFKEPVLQVDQKVDASVLGNISNIPIVPAGNVAGSHGVFDLNATLETLVNGLGSANAQDDLNDVSLSNLFSWMQTTAQNANTALQLATALQQEVINPGYQAPVETTWWIPGTYTYDIPAWAQTAGTLFDLVAVGGGYGGRESVVIAGWGGGAGTWAGSTLVYGTHIPNGTTQLVVEVGDGGGPDEPGEDVTFSLPNTTLLLVANGASTQISTSPNGQSPGNFAHAGRPYFGGAEVAVNKPGAAPGGGGGGGGWGFDAGEAGAPGQAWLTVRQP